MRFFLPLVLVLISLSAFGDGASQNYPELLVVPKASERLNIEAANGNSSTLTSFLPLHVAGATTLLAGVMALGDLDKDKDKEGNFPKIAIAVGGGWLATSVWLQMNYRPYLKATSEVKKISVQNMRSQLAMERMAEEHINQIASLGKKIKWLSFITNAGASALTIDSSKKDSGARGMAVLGVATSFLPLLFTLKWEQVSEDQQSYKKKIFGPVTFSNGVLVNPVNQKPTMGLLLAAYFN